MDRVLFSAEEIGSLRIAAAGSPGEIVIATDVEPVSLLRAAAPLFSQAQLVCHPDGTVLAGLGSAWSASGTGEDRFVGLTAKIESVAHAATAPIFAGFSFHSDGPHTAEWDGFHGIDAILPQVAVIATAMGRTLTLTKTAGLDLLGLIDVLAAVEEPGAVLPFEPGDHSVVSHPPSAHWRSEVEEALAAIAQGDLSKVVLSRSVVVTVDLEPSVFDLVDHLRDTYPQCYVFVWQTGDAAFVGASPELLLEKSGGSVRVNPLAGTARRGEGEADDRAVGEALMHSPKDREEHALVVQDIAARLGPVAIDLEIPAGPSLRRMATVQHLSTEIVARVDRSTPALELVDLLHPTPAVGGTPRETAVAFVEKIEGIDRGWYAGGIGWLTADGDATFAIPLRCALIRGRTALLYAGAGIVADSKPEAELDETRLKFRPMLSLLTAT